MSGLRTWYWQICLPKILSGLGSQLFLLRRKNNLRSTFTTSKPPSQVWDDWEWFQWVSLPAEPPWCVYQPRPVTTKSGRDEMRSLNLTGHRADILNGSRQICNKIRLLSAHSHFVCWANWPGHAAARHYQDPHIVLKSELSQTTGLKSAATFLIGLDHKSRNLIGWKMLRQTALLIVCNNSLF